MSSSIRKIIKCVIAFSFIFTVVGCGSSKEKTNKETAEVIKNDKNCKVKSRYLQVNHIHVLV